jgi:hypothetical protein
MAATQTTQKGFGLLGDFENWIAQKQDDVDRLKNQAVAAGRDAWTQATQASQNLFAPKPDNPPTTNPRAGSGQPQPVAPAQPTANPIPNAWAPVLDPAMAVTRGVGNVVGVGRGVVHSGEGLLGTAAFLARLANPLDKVLSPPGTSPSDHMISAANQAANYVMNGVRNPGSVLQDVKDTGHRLLAEVDPSASPPASTLAGEFQRNFNIGQNQGEFRLDAGLLAFGGPFAEGLESMTAVPEVPGIAKYLEKGFTNDQAEYLAEPYVGQGHHFAISQSAIKKFNIPSFIGESPLNVLKPEGIERGEFYKRHSQVDLDFHNANLPKRVGGGKWTASEMGIEKYGLLGRLWYGSPTPFKTAVGNAYALLGLTGKNISDHMQNDQH